MIAIMLDTETCNTLTHEGKLDMSNVLPYDLGMCALNTDNGYIYERKSLVIDEIFNGMKDLMESAYYADKIPQYNEDIINQKREVVNIYVARRVLVELMKKYNTKVVVSHNARFDNIALKNLSRYLTKSKYREFLPYGTEYYDTLKMARDTICKEEDYKEFCFANGFVTKHKTPRPRATAEVLYKYIKNDLEFIESHTGLEDCLIEAEIMTYIYNHYTDFRKALYEKK